MKIATRKDAIITQLNLAVATAVASVNAGRKYYKKTPYKFTKDERTQMVEVMFDELVATKIIDNPEVSISVTYKGLPDWNKDQEIEEVYGKYHSGAGFGLGERDHSGMVPKEFAKKVAAELRCIPGVKVHIYK